MTTEATGSDWHRRGQEYEDIPDYRQAAECYRRAVEVEPENPHYVVTLASTLSSMGEYEEAVQWYKRAFELEPDNYRHPQMGGRILLHRLHRPEEAVEFLEAAQSLAGDAPDLGWLIVQGLSAVGRHPEAIAKAERLVEAAPSESAKEKAPSVALLADVLAAAGRGEEAIRAHRDALDHDPESSSLQEFINLLIHLNRWEEAGKALEQEIQVWGHRFGAWRTYGYVLEKQGKNREAAHAYKGAIELDRHYPVVMMERLRGEAPEGDVAARVPDILEGLSSWPYASDLERAAICETLAGLAETTKPALALAFFQGALELGHPEEDAIRHRIELLQERVERFGPWE